MPSPPQLANLVAWYKADTGVFQDTGGTTPATTTGQSVALWQDQSGAGNHILQTIVGERPTYATGALNGLPSITFLATGAQFLQTSASVTLGISTGNWWIAAVYITPSSASTGSVLAVGNYNPLFYLLSSSKFAFYSAGAHTFAQTWAVNTSYLTEWTCTAGTVTLYNAQVGTSPTADANTFTSTGINNNKIYVGQEGDSGNLFTGQICEILVYNTALNSTDKATLESYLNGKYYNTPYTFAASGLAISGGYGGTTEGPSPGAAGMAISGSYGGITFPIASPTAGMVISGGYGSAVFPGIISSAAGLAISGSYGGITFPIASPTAGMVISGGYGSAVFPGIISSAAGLAISGGFGTSTAGPSPGMAGLAITGYPGSAVFPGIISSAAGLAISGYPGTSTAGPSPGMAGLVISGGMGSIAETVTVLLTGLGISGYPGGATGGEYMGPFYLPYEYTSVLIEAGNENPFGIDPEATTIITVGLTTSD